MWKRSTFRPSNENKHEGITKDRLKKHEKISTHRRKGKKVVVESIRYSNTRLRNDRQSATQGIDEQSQRGKAKEDDAVAKSSRCGDAS